ncbi:MAG: alpha-2-macroglobulin family protein, partial [Anaerolineae bacterium]|nr:alpha-2-macroglobulin family protein [Anaerolineae bacterium]
MRIDDPQGKELYNDLLSLNEMGTLHGELLLSAEAPLGTYYLTLSHDDVEFYASTSFQVAEYRKPEYEVQVKPDRDAYIDGDQIAVTSEATYYFGGAVGDANVRWSALSSGYAFDYHCPAGEVCPAYSWTDYDVTREADDEVYYDSYGKLIAEGETKTDAQGRVTFRVPADISKETQSRRFTLEAAVTDINGQEVSNRAAVIVHQGAFYVGLAPRGYLAEVGDKQQVDVLTVDWESKPVSRVPLEVVFLEEKWYSVRQQADNGTYYWDWTVEEVPVFTTTVTTDGKGRAVTSFTPERPGSYKVRAVGRDQYEHRIRSSAFFWVWGGGYVSWRQENDNRIDLVADRDKYAVGDTAEILIPSPYSGTVKALVTIERGHVLETSVRTLRSNTEVLRIPIEEDYAPNVFVSILLMQGADHAADGLASFKMGVIDLPVSVEEKALTITLTPDRLMEKGETYKPRQKAVYTVRVTDSTGEPVEAELSLRLADLAVLALADDPGPTLLDSFWSERGLGVRTSLPLVVAMEPYNRDLAPGAKGGGGGADFDAGGLVRSKFADTAFWDPVVRTDKNGMAKVEVELPDNLTTWRMQARGITAETQVGHAEVDVLSTLDLLVRPVLPRFFVVGDHAEIATVVNNNTEAQVEAEVRISVEGLSLEGPDHQKVKVPAGEAARVAWPVTALAESAAVVHMEVQAKDGLSDAREDTLPIYRYATPEVVATAGRLSEAGVVQEIVQLPRSFDPTQGELSMQLDGSLTAATQDALSYLEHYPYECTEQTVSRFLPNVLTYRALEEMDLERPELRAELTERVSLALQRLYNEQHYDGGWGWWVSDESDAYLTAYVLQGLLEAHRAGFVVERDVMDRALGFLRENLTASSATNQRWGANRLAYQLYVMADYATLFEKKEVARDLGRAVQLFGRREQLNTYGRAMLAVALHLMEPDEPSRVDTLLSDLAGEAVLSATGTHWEEAEPDYWNMNTDIRTTAIAIWAMARLDPEDTQIPNAVRWLMSVRKEGAWETTQATSWSLLALVEVMRTTGELEGDFDYTVYLNGQTLEEGTVAQETIDESRELQVAIAQLLVEEGNRLVIERQGGDADQTGEGQLYYTAQLRYYLPAE